MSRTRLLYAVFLVLALLAGAVTFAVLVHTPSASATLPAAPAAPVLAPAAPPAAARASSAPAPATVVSTATCRRFDPNLVNGVCLRYSTRRGTGYTWLGTYRADNGRVFFCIDYLYDSSLPRAAQVVPTDRLVNQLGDRVGDPEVAALNYLVSRWAGRGSTGSDHRDAAIALIIREVMADGVRDDGTVVYPRGLKVGQRVQAPRGGLTGSVMSLAQEMWAAGSRYYGGYELALTTRASGPVRLGRTRTYQLSVTSAAGHLVPGVEVRFACVGPVRCPQPVTTTQRPVPIAVQPKATGTYRIKASVTGPASDGRLYVLGSWRPHDRRHGVQRGWIAGESRATATVEARAEIVRARPRVVTRTSEAVVTPGAAIHDEVEVSGLPDGYAATVRASLYGPFPAQPGPSACVKSALAGSVTFPVKGNGTYTTPPITVDQVGYYTWVEDFPGDERTVPVTTVCGLVEETTQVVKATPTISTVASEQRAFVGAELFDTVVVGGTGERPVTVEWTLHGPLPVRGGSCDGLTWSGAPVADRGSFPAPRDGRYRTGTTTLREGGCYTYSERIPPTAYTNEATSKPGQPLETALVERRTPKVSTVASEQHALVGSSIYDTVEVRGLPDWASVPVTWRLHGPIAPRPDGSCDRLDWKRAPVADTGEFVARGNGRYRSERTVLGASGCYTYSERLPLTPSTTPAHTEPGIPVETALVTRPAIPYVPEVPTGPAGRLAQGDEGGEADRAAKVSKADQWVVQGTPSSAKAAAPTARSLPRYLTERYRSPAALVRRAPGATLSIPSVGIEAPVDSVGLDRGSMAVPNDIRRVGWLAGSSGPADMIGSSVISGHISDRRDRPGALWRLRQVKAGDRVRWTVGGQSQVFEVRSVRRYARSAGVPAELFRTDGPRLLHLVTCANKVRRGSGFHYTDNLVVTARRL